MKDEIHRLKNLKRRNRKKWNKGRSEIIDELEKKTGNINQTKAVAKKDFVRLRNLYPKNSFYVSERWLELRYIMLRRFGRRCMCCGSTTGEMHVDHIKPRSKYPELQYCLDNLQVLCKSCNLGKRHKFEDDWRDKPKEIAPSSNEIKPTKVVRRGKDGTLVEVRII